MRYVSRGSGADGNFSINISLYDNLEIIAKLAAYENATEQFVKEDGVIKVVNVMMVKK